MIDSTSLLGVALGGAIGSLVRMQLLRLGTFSASSLERTSARLYPAIATLIANTIGCLVLGDWLATPPTEPTRATALGDFVAVGLCGGLTTFSTLCGDAVRLTRSEGPVAAAVYLAATFALGTGGLWLGLGRPPLG